ncbi:812_t:CDS:2 [Funneliformis mosseae]|uniref:812_t:CDS:1 n=1 Tax=Funneliformis mosseae TaxID=27381 RepID=A0A9N8VEQ9_FUNMO|nr:812_t:CDS:2 [Funneliformis mosseae]
MTCQQLESRKRNCGSAFPKNKEIESDYEPHKRQCTEPIADAVNNPFFESENNLDKEEVYKSQRDNNDVSYDEESPNLYDVDFYSTSDDELPEEVKHLDVNDALIRDIFLEVLHQFQSNDLESGKTIMSSNFLNGIIDIIDSKVKESLPNKFNDMEQFTLDIKILMDFQKDVLKIVKSVNKPINEIVYKFEVEISSQKEKKAKNKKKDA